MALKQPASARPTVAGLPTYALYGEPGRTQATEALHCERIAERSQRHDWEIAPHRHAALFQILHIQRGQAQAALEAGSLALTGPCVLLVPALVPHGFVFAPDIEGSVITVLEPHLQRLLQATPPLAARLLQARLLQWPDGAADAQAVDGAVAQLVAAYASTGDWRHLVLDAALLQLAVVLGRLLPAPAAPGGAVGVGVHAGVHAGVQAGLHAGVHVGAGARAAGRGGRPLAHVQRYRSLVEARFREQPALTTLAGTLGITPTQLNRVCHQVLGHSALGVLHGRLVLEAQRDLAYTTLAIKQIAAGLGFADAGYFTRFFQRQTGQTPTAWRAQGLR